VQFEECPKWLAIKEILSEIEADVDSSLQVSADDDVLLMLPGSDHILIAAKDDRICSQIQDVRRIYCFAILHNHV